MSYISDSVKLLGLIVKTKPFSYSNNVLTCEYSAHVDVDDIKTLKNDLQSRVDDKNRIYTDEERLSINDDIYFLNTVIEELQKASM